MKSCVMTIRTSARTQMLDITRQVEAAVADSGIQDGICVVTSPHTTAGLTINENADPDVQRDITREIDKIVPWSDGYAHVEGNSAAHLKASMMGFSETIVVEDGSLMLGTWQDIYFMEFDGPRTRHFRVKIMGE